MKKTQIACPPLFESDENFPESLEPRMGCFHHPTPLLESRCLFEELLFNTSGNDMRDIPPGFNRRFGRGSGISRVGIEILPGRPVFRRRNLSFQNCVYFDLKVLVGTKKKYSQCRALILKSFYFPMS